MGSGNSPTFFIARQGSQHEREIRMNNHEVNIGITIPNSNFSVVKNAVATQRDIEDAHKQMSSPSEDWTKLSNILRRSCGGSSRKRSFRR
ncbi:hypothetical protein D8666_11940 [Ochrobactrum soli]|uniref:Uncharacterized protein n=1 Tax=Falsochrobactrum shanghaiense TaxID=2201899 RepID=A0A316JDQ9_9HYPH|nr:hypothetical protein DKP76_06960 [Falsochrobactrum shanghaiense]RLL73941.1 hypothetical protein D8666_11940 [[Ochrobactrum] soli]